MGKVTGEQDPKQAPAPANNEEPLPPKPAIKVPPTAAEITDDDEKARRYENVRGQLVGYRSSVEQYTGALEQRLHTLTASLAQANTTIKKLEGVIESLQGEIGEIPTLKERGGLADNLQQQVERLSLLMTYPQIVGAVQVEEVEQEDGTKEEVRENPVLEMLMSSSLTGDAFKASVEKLLPTFGAPAPPPTETGSVTPATPVTQDQTVELWNQYVEARQSGDNATANRLLDQYQEAKYK